MFVLIFIWNLVRYYWFVVTVQWHQHRKLVPKIHAHSPREYVVNNLLGILFNMENFPKKSTKQRINVCVSDGCNPKIFRGSAECNIMYKVKVQSQSPHTSYNSQKNTNKRINSSISSALSFSLSRSLPTPLVYKPPFTPYSPSQQTS